MTKPALILLADDDQAMRQMLAVTLRQRGITVEEYEDGRALLDGIEAYVHREVIPDMVVSDIQMPGATGFDVLRRLRECLPEVAMILITAFGDAQTHRRARQLGATLVIDKPFDLQRLHEDVNRLLARDARP